MKTVNTKIKIGVEKPFSILHITDTHLMFANESDDELKNKLAVDRWNWIPAKEGMEKLDYAYNIHKETAFPIFHTGDLIDFVSNENLKRAKEFIDKTDCFFACGNHEFSKYLYFEELNETPEYRAESFDEVQSAHRNDISFASKIINGVNMVAIDDSYYTVDADQFSKLKAEVAKGLPIVLFMHVPIYCKEMYERFYVSPSRPLFMLNAPEELIKEYPKENYIQQKTDALTAEATEYILNEPLIKACVTGHLHADFECMLNDHLLQIVTDMTTARIIEFE